MHNNEFNRIDCGTNNIAALPSVRVSEYPRSLHAVTVLYNRVTVSLSVLVFECPRGLPSSSSTV